MLELAIAGGTFIALHLLISGTRIRDAVVSTVGDGPYMGLFSLASLASLVWMVFAYRAVGPGATAWWVAPSWWLYLGTPINLVALVLIVLGLTTPNPTLTQMESLLQRDDVVKGIIRITRHPMLMGMLLWSAYHLTANGDLASQIFFGTFVVTTALGPKAIDAKRARKYGRLWRPFAKKTSILPFAAIAAGRNQLVWSEIGMGRVAIGLVVFLAFWVAHSALFGVPAWPGG